MDKASFRIIDANFNRAREGLRVAEEFCRFSLDCPALSGTAKQLRHQLCTAIAALNSEKLLAARDTDADVGCGLKIDAPLKRKNQTDCLTAAFARTTEALRVLAEIISTDDAIDTNNTEIASRIEQIRYATYTLQKDVAIFAVPAAKFASVSLYCIVGDCHKKSPLELTKICAQNGADCIQLRIKNISDKALLTLAAEFVDICEQNNVISIINDRVDIACTANADGVHLGTDDISPEQGRKFQLKPLIIGQSTHNDNELQSAIAQRPTYIATGAVFASATKKDVGAVGLDYAEKANRILKEKAIAHVAVGGIDSHNIKGLLGIGIKTIAVSSYICDSDDPYEKCQQLKKILG